MSKSNKRQAVIVIHGIGNQFPMDTTREFVESLKDDDDILYSSPDREANFFETRRLSLSRKKTDFYEFYWANLVTEPSSSDLCNWIIRLLFVKKPSERIKKLVYKIRFILIVAFLAFAYMLYKDISLSIDENGLYAWHTGIFTFGTLFLYRILIPLVNGKASRTIGDAVKYMTPSPENIDSRFKIRQKGINLLKKLHEKKDEEGNLLYDKIIIVGHSLGSVVGYDLITNLWHDYLYQYSPHDRPVLQPILKEISNLINTKHKEKDNKDYVFPLENYQKLQNKLFAELKGLGNPWLISDFITVGSPLCHGDFIMTKDYASFDRKTNYRELPLNPPKIEVKTENGKIVKNYRNSISYPKLFLNKSDDDFVRLKVINHSSQFSFIRWNNFYFKNDFVGGDLSFYFGEGIHNTELKPEGNWFRRNLPFFSHTNYWDKEQIKSVDELKKIIWDKNNFKLL